VKNTGSSFFIHSAKRTEGKKKAGGLESGAGPRPGRKTFSEQSLSTTNWGKRITGEGEERKIHLPQRGADAPSGIGRASIWTVGGAIKKKGEGTESPSYAASKLPLQSSLGFSPKERGGASD